MQNVLSRREGQRVRRSERESPHPGGASDAESHAHQTRQRVGGQPDAHGPRVVGLKDDYDNSVGNAGQRLLSCTILHWWSMDGYALRLRRCARFSGNGQDDRIIMKPAIAIRMTCVGVQRRQPRLVTFSSPMFVPLGYQARTATGQLQGRGMCDE